MSVRYYRQLLGQTDRIEAFRRALHATVRPGDVVLDVGAGLGTFSFFAADAGAKHVWGIDGDPIINVAKVIGRVNEYDDRVSFRRGWLPDVGLPDACDVLVFEDFPPRLVDTQLFRLFRDLHRRHASSSVRSVPCRAVCYLAPVRSPSLRADAIAVGPGGREDALGIDFTPSRDYVANQPDYQPLAQDDLVGEPVALGEFRFDAVPNADGLGGDATWEIAAGALDGLAYWFDLELSPGEWLSNAPGADPGSWGHLFLPFDPAVELDGASPVRCAVRRDRAPDGAPTWISWRVQVGDVHRAGHEFSAAPAGFQDILPFIPEAIPELTRGAVLEALVLQLTDGSRSIREIADRVREMEPGLDQQDAERLVGRALHGRVTAGRATLEQGGRRDE